MGKDMSSYFISECGQSTVHTHRIVGGTETAVNEFPWIAGIVMKDADSEHRNKVRKSVQCSAKRHIMGCVILSEGQRNLQQAFWQNSLQNRQL